MTDDREEVAREPHADLIRRLREQASRWGVNPDRPDMLLSEAANEFLRLDALVSKEEIDSPRNHAALIRRAKQAAQNLDHALAWATPHVSEYIRKEIFEANIALREAAAALSRPSSEPTGWRPASEEPPRDGTKFDVWRYRDGRLVDVYWSDVQDAWCTDGMFGPEEPSPLGFPAFEYWMLTPPPPSSGAQQGGE